MTEQEALVFIQSIPSKIWDQLQPCDNEAVEMAIKALEEIQELRILKDLEAKGFLTIDKTCEEFEKEIRNKAIDEAIEASAKEICVGCGYLDGHKCTYKGANCSVSKPMLEVVVNALEQMKGGE